MFCQRSVKGVAGGVGGAGAEGEEDKDEAFNNPTLGKYNSCNKTIKEWKLH